MPKQVVKRKSRIDSKKSVQKEPLLNRTQKTIATIISILVLGGMIWNYGAKADARYAKESPVAEAFVVLVSNNIYLQNKIDIMELTAKRNDVQSRVWALEKEFRNSIMPDSVKQQKEALEKDLRDLDEAIGVYRRENVKIRPLILPDTYPTPPAAKAPDFPAGWPGGAGGSSGTNPAGPQDPYKNYNKNPYLQRGF